MNTTLTVTPLEDRFLAAVLLAAKPALPAIGLAAAKVALTPADPAPLKPTPAADGLMGLTRNHNETFVRRPRGKR